MSMRGGGAPGGQRRPRALAVSASCVRTLEIAAASVGWWQVAGNGVGVPPSRQNLEYGSGSRSRRGGARGGRARRVPRAVLRRPLAAARC